MAVGGKVHSVRSSLPYQMLLYCNGWYFAFYILAEILIFVYKGEMLPYPNAALPSELILLFFMGVIEYIRLFFGQKGNLTERVIAVVLCIFLSIPSVFGAVYMLIWQTYVLRLEAILAAIQIAFIGLEFVFGLISCITFARATPY